VLLGFLSLAVDAGVLFVNRTELQKAADAAAIAGAYDYTISSTGCSATPAASGTATPLTAQQQDAVNYAGYNHALSSEVIYNTAPTSPPSLGSGIYCFWQVTVQRTDVALVFAPFVGHSHLGTVAATAIAYKSPVSGVGNPVPYALWGGNTDNQYLPTDPPETGEPYDIGCTRFNQSCSPGSLDLTSGLNTNGTDVYIKDNNWTRFVYPNHPPDACGGSSQPPCNGNWLVNSNSFKGYLHINNSPGVYYSVGQNVDSGSGNASSAQLANMCAMASSTPKQAAAVLVATPACDGSQGCPSPLQTPPNGQIDLYVAAIRGMYLDSDVCGTGSGASYSGRICIPSVDPRCTVADAKGGGNDPNAPTVVKLAL